MNPNQAMAESLGEQLSALMDGELARDQVRFLLRGVEAQPDLARRWSNYQLIGASLKREYIELALPADFAERVIGRLDAEIRVVVSSPSRRVGLGALRWVGGGAIAAAVAVVALTVSRPIDNVTGPAIAAVEQPSSRQLSQPYLPLAVPLPNTSSLVFNNNAVQPVSFEQVLPSYYQLTNGARLVPGQVEGYRASLRQQHMPTAQESSQLAAPDQH
jgi:sigma-E factor negative regulatory protein RseA